MLKNSVFSTRPLAPSNGVGFKLSVAFKFGKVSRQLAQPPSSTQVDVRFIAARQGLWQRGAGFGRRHGSRSAVSGKQQRNLDVPRPSRAVARGHDVVGRLETEPLCFPKTWDLFAARNRSIDAAPLPFRCSLTKTGSATLL